MSKAKKKTVIKPPVNEPEKDLPEMPEEEPKPEMTERQRILKEAHQMNEWELEDLKEEVVARILVRRDQVMKDALHEAHELTMQIERVIARGELKYYPGSDKPSLVVDGKPAARFMDEILGGGPCRC